MSDQYVGEIRLFSGNYAPQGWAMCNGQLLSISQYEVLYVLLGTTYGGDGRTTFALPDLRGRAAMHMGTNPATGTNFVMGQMAGTEKVTLISSQLPAHTHAVNAQSVDGTSNSPTNNFWATNTTTQYSSVAPNNVMDPAALSSVGGNQPHDNMMPFITLTYIIATEGIFPSQG